MVEFAQQHGLGGGVLAGAVVQVGGLDGGSDAGGELAGELDLPGRGRAVPGDGEHPERPAVTGGAMERRRGSDRCRRRRSRPPAGRMPPTSDALALRARR